MQLQFFVMLFHMCKCWINKTFVYYSCMSKYWIKKTFAYNSCKCLSEASRNKPERVRAVSEIFIVMLDAVLCNFTEKDLRHERCSGASLRKTFDSNDVLVLHYLFEDFTHNPILPKVLNLKHHESCVFKHMNPC